MAYNHVDCSRRTREEEKWSRNPRERQQNLAVLIDADNTSPSVIEYLFAEIAKYGMASVKRIYGDWTSPYLKGWKEVLLTYAIHPSSSSTTP